MSEQEETMNDEHQKPVIISVPLADIDYPAEFQRALAEKRAKRIAESFDPAACGALLVSKRDDRYVIVDGNHRLTALRALGYTTWPCVVLLGDEAAEPRLFVTVNTTRVRPTAMDLFRARLAGGDAIAQGIVDVCESMGVAIGSSGDHHNRPMRTRAVVALERVYRKGGPMMLAEVIRICTKSWPDDPRHLDGDLLVGVVAFLFYYRRDRNFDRARALEKFSARPLTAIRQRAKELGNRGNGNSYRFDGSGFAAAPGIVKSLVEAYNFRLQGKRLEEPTLAGWLKVNQAERAA